MGLLLEALRPYLETEGAGQAVVPLRAGQAVEQHQALLLLDLWLTVRLERASRHRQVYTQ